MRGTRTAVGSEGQSQKSEKRSKQHFEYGAAVQSKLVLSPLPHFENFQLFCLFDRDFPVIFLLH